MRRADWEHLPHFLAVARAGSLRAAAELLGANYGTVNRAVQALEASYGVRLFHRARQGFTLTESGAALLPLAEAAEQKVLAARKGVEGLDRSEAGKIRFSVTPTLAYDFLAPLIAEFSTRYPAIDVEVRLTAEVESIPNDETDISLRAAPTVSDDVVARKLFPLSVGVYASESYLKRALPGAGPAGEGLIWIGQPDGVTGTADPRPAQFQNADLRHQVTDGYMRARLVAQGVGLSRLPVLFERVFPDLVRVPGTEVIQGPWLWLLLHSDLRRTVRVRRFVDFMTEALMALHRGR